MRQETWLEYAIHVLAGVFVVTVFLAVIFLFTIITLSAYDDWRDKRSGKKDKNTLF